MFIFCCIITVNYARFGKYRHHRDYKSLELGIMRWKLRLCLTFNNSKFGRWFSVVELEVYYFTLWKFYWKSKFIFNVWKVQLFGWQFDRLYKQTTKEQIRYNKLNRTNKKYTKWKTNSEEWPRQSPGNQKWWVLVNKIGNFYIPANTYMGAFKWLACERWCGACKPFKSFFLFFNYFYYSFSPFFILLFLFIFIHFLLLFLDKSTSRDAGS